jgi:hypothetical protein
MLAAPREELGGAYTSRVDISLVGPFLEALQSSRMTLEKIKLSPLTIDFNSLWSMTFPNLRALYLRNVDKGGPEGRSLGSSRIPDEAWTGMVSRTQRRREMIRGFFIRHTTLEDLGFTFSRGSHIFDWIPERLEDDCLPNLRKFSGSYLIFMWLIANEVTLSPLGTTLRTVELDDINPLREQEWPGMLGCRHALFRSLTRRALKKKVDQQSSAPGSVCKPLLSGLETLDLVTLEPYQAPSDFFQDLASELRIWSDCCGDTLRTLKIPLILGRRSVLDPHLLPMPFAGFKTLEYLDQILITGSPSWDLNNYIEPLARHLPKLKAISLTDRYRCQNATIKRRPCPHGDCESQVSFELYQFKDHLFREW